MNSFGEFLGPPRPAEYSKRKGNVQYLQENALGLPVAFLPELPHTGARAAVVELVYTRDLKSLA